MSINPLEWLVYAGINLKERPPTTATISTLRGTNALGREHPTVTTIPRKHLKTLSKPNKHIGLPHYQLEVKMSRCQSPELKGAKSRENTSSPWAKSGQVEVKGGGIQTVQPSWTCQTDFVELSHLHNPAAILENRYDCEV
jgi:hypothetical protein